jgi:solute:Na+ symporter, SSS family
VGTGPGLVLILRWYWWRINAWAELAAMLAGFIVGFLTSIENPIYNLQIADFGHRIMVTAGITLLVWVPIMLLTKPESDAKLDAFYTRVRPGGPGWKRQRERTGIQPAQDLAKDAQRVLAGLMILFGCMFAVGGLLLYKWYTFGGMAVTALVGFLWLRHIGPSIIAPPTYEAPTHPAPENP